MSSYDDTLRAELLGVRDEVIAGLVADGVIFRELEVRLVVETRTGANAAHGEPGTITRTMTAVTPRPQVDLRDQFRYRGGAPTHVGDAALRISRAALTEAQLLGASYFLIGGNMLLVEDGSGMLTEAGWLLLLEGGEDVPVRYSVIDGELKREAFDWVVVLGRVAGG